MSTTKDKDGFSIVSDPLFNLLFLQNRVILLLCYITL